MHDVTFLYCGGMIYKMDAKDIVHLPRPDDVVFLNSTPYVVRNLKHYTKHNGLGFDVEVVVDDVPANYS